MKAQLFCKKTSWAVITENLSCLDLRRVLPAVVLALFFTMAPQRAQALAEEGYEELSYQDLVDRLQTKKKKISQPQAHPLDQINLHASLGLTTSMNSYRVKGRDVSRAMNGFQVAMGIDLFSPEWVSELALRNFGTRESGGEKQSQREVDLKVSHLQAVTGGWTTRVGAGLSTRYLRYVDAATDVNVSQESPSLMASLGLETKLSPQIILGGDFGLRTALTDQSLDRNSMDLIIRLETLF